MTSTEQQNMSVELQKTIDSQALLSLAHQIGLEKKLTASSTGNGSASAKNEGMHASPTSSTGSPLIMHRMLTHDMFVSPVSERSFHALLQEEVQKVNACCRREYGQIVKSVIALVQKGSENDVCVAETTLRSLSKRFVDLQQIVKRNYEALLQVVAEFDSCCEIDSAPWVLAQVQGAPGSFCALDTDRILLWLSVGWGLVRELQKASNDKKHSSSHDVENNSSAPPASASASASAPGGRVFVRSTTKYWVRPEYLSELKSAILEHVPLLVFGKSELELRRQLMAGANRVRSSSMSKEQEDNNEQDDNHSGNSEVNEARSSLRDETTILGSRVMDERPEQDISLSSGDSQLITSVYLDSLSGSCYDRRIKGVDGATLIRIRWYGCNDGSGSKQVFFERKVHRESYTCEVSEKSRFSCQQRIVPTVLDGDASEQVLKGLGSAGSDSIKIPDLLGKIQDESVTKLISSIVSEIKSRNLVPMVRTSYYRTAFQTTKESKKAVQKTGSALSAESDSPMLRISIDSQLSMINELLNESSKMSQSSELALPTTGSKFWCRHPLSVLGESDVCKFPFAILEVKLSGSSSGEYPQWLSSLLARVDAKRVDRFSKFQHGFASFHQGRVRMLPQWFSLVPKGPSLNIALGPSMAGDQSRALHAPEFPETDLVLPKLEPKLLLANERTFLHYIGKVLFVFGIAIGLVKRNAGSMLSNPVVAGSAPVSLNQSSTSISRASSSIDPTTELYLLPSLLMILVAVCFALLAFVHYLTRKQYLSGPFARRGATSYLESAVKSVLPNTWDRQEAPLYVSAMATVMLGTCIVGILFSRAQELYSD